MTDFLFYCNGECEDALRDRTFYIVKSAQDEAAARAQLQVYFTMNSPRDIEQDWDVFLYGERITEGLPVSFGHTVISVY